MKIKKPGQQKSFMESASSVEEHLYDEVAPWLKLFLITLTIFYL